MSDFKPVSGYNRNMGTQLARKKIALVGPTLPFRSGVAQYTSQLHESLNTLSEVEVCTVSFKRQYPKWLYPGKTDRDETAVAHDDVTYMIDAYNPLTWRKAADYIAEQGCEVAILDWWTLFWQPGFAYIAHRLKSKGVKPVFLCHNLFDHDAKGVKRKIAEILLMQAEGYIVHSSEQQKMLKAMNPSADVILKAHPVYDRFPEPRKRLKKRDGLEILFFGFIRPYKGLPILIEALQQLNNKEIFPTIVGEPWGDAIEMERKLASSGVPNLDLQLRYVDDSEAANYFDRADLVVLPYLSATGSGVVGAAFHYGKPVLSTTVGGLKDVTLDDKTGWLVPPNDPKALAEKLATISRADCQALAPSIEEFCLANSWQSMAETIANIT